MTLAIVGSIIVFHSAHVAAFPSFLGVIPNIRRVVVLDSSTNASVPWTAIGHFNPGGGGPRNLFGEEFDQNNFSWSAICNKDSDGDGFTNGEELGDPLCSWVPGGTPSRLFGISHPALRSSIPIVASSATDSQMMLALPGLVNILSPATLWSVRTARDNQINPSAICKNSSSQLESYDCVVDGSSTKLIGPINVSAIPTLIRSLRIVDQGLTGSLDLTSVPPSLLDLNLTSNSLSGRILFSNSTRLRSLDLSFNRFVGSMDLSSLVDLPLESRLILTLTGNPVSTLQSFDWTLVPAGITVVFNDESSAAPAACSVFSCSQRLFAPPLQIPMICGGRHPFMKFSTNAGTVYSVENGSSNPSHCNLCPANGTVDWASPTCSLLRFTRVSWLGTSQANVGLRDDAKNYCDTGCAVAISLFVVGLLLIVCMVVLFRIYCLEPIVEEQRTLRGPGDPHVTQTVVTKVTRTSVEVRS